MPKKVALHTLGCKLNFSETSAIGNQFLKNGFEIVDFKNNADIYVLNTCTVTENAEKECRQIVRRFLRQNPEAFVVVTGCYAQLRPEELSGIEGVDLVLGSKEKFDLISYAGDFNKKGPGCVFVSPYDELNEFGAAHSTDADSRTRAYFKIQDGCDYKCSFCTIPLARGGSRSMPPDKLLDEFKSLIDSGYKEIILTGVNVGDYGKSVNSNLYSVLKRLINVPGKFRIRISSIEPNLLSDEVLKLTADSDKLCRHFHIPLQSGSEKILRSMQRRYKKEDYYRLLNKAKSLIPDLGIGVDVIVGFPGETAGEFNETTNFLTDLPASYLHVFTYSERPDTKAENLPGKVDINERRERNGVLRLLSNKKKNTFYAGMKGKELEVLFEAGNNNGILKGFSSNYVRVAHPFRPGLVNNFADVKIKSAGAGICGGEIVGAKKSIDLIAC